MTMVDERNLVFKKGKENKRGVFTWIPFFRQNVSRENICLKYLQIFVHMRNTCFFRVFTGCNEFFMRESCLLWFSIFNYRNALFTRKLFKSTKLICLYLYKYIYFPARGVFFSKRGVHCALLWQRKRWFIWDIKNIPDFYILQNDDEIFFIDFSRI